MTKQYTITRLGHHGDGIAEGSVYAPRTLPGEIVTGDRDDDQLRDIRIVAPSPDRVKPPCRHYNACGGCQLQHASDAFVSEWKQQIVRGALAAHGLCTEFRPVLTSPPRSRRRATVTVRRTKKGAVAGFLGRGTDVIAEIPDCQLLRPELVGGIPVAKALAMAGASRKAGMSITLTQSQNGLDVAVAGGKPADGRLRVELARIAEQYRIARLAWDGETIAMRAPPVQNFDGIRVTPPPGAFLQATAEGQAALLASVREITAGAERITDLFAGCGTFSLPLAATAQVHAVEGDAEMARALDEARRRAPGLKPVTTEIRDLFRRPLLPDEISGADAVVLDPPRAGAEAQVLQLSQTGLARIAYVSCNPVSFARDARHLVAAGYRLDWIQLVDQFRWSTHVELVGSLTR